MTIYIQELETTNAKHCVISYPNLQKSIFFKKILDMIIVMPPKKTKTPQKQSKTPIPEDYELSDSDEQPKYITLTEEQKLARKNIIIECPICSGNFQVRTFLTGSFCASLHIWR